MAHHHNYPLTFLKTPFGYLTTTGVTDDINDKNLLIFQANTYGIWASFKGKVEYFIEKSQIDNRLKYSIQHSLDECIIYTYWCGQNCNGGCFNKSDCSFWNGDRNLLIYFNYKT